MANTGRPAPYAGTAKAAASAIASRCMVLGVWWVVLVNPAERGRSPSVVGSRARVLRHSATVRVGWCCQLTQDQAPSQQAGSQAERHREVLVHRSSLHQLRNFSRL